MRPELLNLMPKRFYCLGEWHNWSRYKNRNNKPLSSCTVVDPAHLNFKDNEGHSHRVDLYFHDGKLWFAVDGVDGMISVSDINEDPELATAMFEYNDFGQIFQFGFGFYLPDYQKVVGFENSDSDDDAGHSHLYDIYD